MRARGLKPSGTLIDGKKIESRPMRARGLKRCGHIKVLSNVVAPHAGAWIETGIYPAVARAFGSRPMRARGLKQARSEV